MTFDPFSFAPPSENDVAESSPRRQGIMLCYPFEEKRLASWRPPFLVQPKLDGERCRDIAQMEFGRYDPMLVSSELNPIISLPHIKSALKTVHERVKNSLSSWLCGYRFDGELYRHGWSFEQIHSVVSRTVNPHPSSHLVQLHVFDLWNCEKPQWQRLDFLLKLQKHFPPEIVLVPTKICETFEQILNAYDSFIGEGYEGIIVRHLDNLYVPRRSTFVMKFKPKKSDSYEITGVVEAISQSGSGKGMVGALVLKDDMETEFKVSPGTGCTEEKKRSWWKNRDQLLGKTLLVEYQNLTLDRKVPRFGRFPLKGNKFLTVL